MRVLLIADVHANWDSLLTLQRAEPKPDAVLFAGDAVGYGPDPANCVRWLAANAALAVRGNHDEAVNGGALIGAPPELADAAREMINYSRPMLTPGVRRRLGQWPLSASVELGGARFYITHGTPGDPLASQVNIATCPRLDLHSILGGIEADVFVFGHTHIPALRRIDEQVLVNPGSLGQPRYGLPDATYAVWEDGHVQIKHLHYDHAATARKLHLASLSPEVREQLAGILATGLA